MANGGHPGDKPWDPERTNGRRAGTIAGHKGGSTLRDRNPVEVAEEVMGTSGRKGWKQGGSQGRGSHGRVSAHSPLMPEWSHCPQTQELPSGDKD